MAYDSVQRSGQRAHIIVLTDGEPLLLRIDSPYQDDAIQKFNAAGKDSLSIVYYDDILKDKTFEKAFAGRIFKARAGNLKKELEKMIPEEVVAWTFANTNSAASVIEKFHVPVEIEDWPPSDAGVVDGERVLPERRYGVKAVLGKAQPRIAPVRVQGGEAFLFNWNSGSLGHVPYVDSEKLDVFDRLSVPTESAYDVHVGRAYRDGAGTMNVQIVVENKDQQVFTAAPQ